MTLLVSVMETLLLLVCRYQESRVLSWPNLRGIIPMGCEFLSEYPDKKHCLESLRP